MRRKPGALIPLEEAILACGLDRRRSNDEFYGFAIAKRIAQQSGSLLPTHGALYKALGRMERAGLVSSRWEDPSVAEEAGRPRRRLYAVTQEGVKALAAARQARGESIRSLQARLASS